MTTTYDAIGTTYSYHRRSDPRIGAAIVTGLGDAVTVLNVGAGSGSYEPADRSVVAVEPSSVMIAQREPGAAPCVRACAEWLPVATNAVDAVLAVLTLHHWSDWSQGLRECARVARRRVVILTWDPASDGFWLTRDYFPEIVDVDRRIFPSIGDISRTLGDLQTTRVSIPNDCTDGFFGAYWQRPEAYLDAAVRSGMSTFSRVGDPEARLTRLRQDLGSGEWARRNGDNLGKTELDIGYRLLVAERTSLSRSVS